jgi:hypothetical protein
VGAPVRRLSQNEFGELSFEVMRHTFALDSFETHARRLLQHVNLRAIAWINIRMKHVTFITLER